MICKAYLLAQSIDINAIPSEKKLREVAYLKIENNIFVIFPYGVVVCWGDGNLSNILVVLRNHTQGDIASDKMLYDEFDLILSSKRPAKLVFEDTIYLEDMDELALIAISHPIAQSLRLEQHEDAILESIQKVKHIPNNLAKFGKISESKKQISKMQGKLFVLKGNINFEHSILDKPEYFWEYPEYDNFYNRMSDYLEINQRIEVLYKKMTTIDETLSILSNELNHRHSSKLELIIILLILIEIVIFFLQDIFHLI